VELEHLGWNKRLRLAEWVSVMPMWIVADLLIDQRGMTDRTARDHYPVGLRWAVGMVARVAAGGGASVASNARASSSLRNERPRRRPSARHLTTNLFPLRSIQGIPLPSSRGSLVGGPLLPPDAPNTLLGGHK
jgi:hypothetical protein